MAASTSATCAISSGSPSTPFPLHQHAVPHCVRLPALPPPRPRFTLQNRKTGADCYRMARDVVVMATGESLATGESTDDAATELPEIVKTVQDTWDKLDDKYAVISIGFTGIVALWGSIGLISAIDRIPLIPGVLELIGIGYIGWFTYQNLIFKPDREVLIAKIKSTYGDIIGSS